jgi:hypothetical protein
MISRGERGSSSGIAAISDPTASMLSTLMRCAGAGFRRDAGGARFLFEREPYGFLDGEALRGGQTFGERLDFLGQLDHGALLARKGQ